MGMEYRGCLIMEYAACAVCWLYIMHDTLLSYTLLSYPHVHVLYVLVCHVLCAMSQLQCLVSHVNESCSTYERVMPHV